MATPPAFHLPAPASPPAMPSNVFVQHNVQLPDMPELHLPDAWVPPEEAPHVGVPPEPDDVDAPRKLRARARRHYSQQTPCNERFSTYGGPRPPPPPPPAAAIATVLTSTRSLPHTLVYIVQQQHKHKHKGISSKEDVNTSLSSTCQGTDYIEQNKGWNGDGASNDMLRRAQNASCGGG